MNEFRQIAENRSPLRFYLRIFRENGKLRLKALEEAITEPPRPYDFTMEFAQAPHYQVIICIYFDGLEPDFKVNERIQSKILTYFSNAFFYKPG
jgi:hypothetical protein